jgi:hypothetical protein
MRPAVSVLLFCGLSIPSWPQTPVRLSMLVDDYSLQANSFIDALLKLSLRFLVPMGVEWVKSADTLKPVQFTRTHTTAADVIRVVVSTHAGYAWRMEDGVVHVFQRDLVKDRRNPLNITIDFDEEPETVTLANNDLFQMVSHVARTPELPGIAYNRFGSAVEPVFSFAARSGPARSILSKIVTAGLSAAMPSMKRVWVATFPENPVYSRTGFLEVVPMLDPKFVSSQPFWILLSYGEPPPEKMEK